MSALTRVDLVVYGIQSDDLTRGTMKILGIYLSHSKKLMDQNNYCETISNIHGILTLWRTKSFSIEGKIVVFKTLAISKLVYLPLLTVIPNDFIDKIAKIQKAFIKARYIKNGL